MADLQKIRQRLHKAVATGGVYAGGNHDTELADIIFDQVAGVIRRHFGLSLDQADILLADAKADAVRTLGNTNTDQLVNLDDVIDAIAVDLADSPNISVSARSGKRPGRSRRKSADA